MTKATYSETITRNALNLEHRLKKLIEENLTIGQMSNELRISPATVSRYLRCLELHVPKQGKVKTGNRDEVVSSMMEMRKSGKTLKEIGDHYNVSRECVRQKLARWCPDVVFQSVSRKQKVCDNCGEFFTPAANHIRYCSKKCGEMGRHKEPWNRDRAEQIMNLRDQGMTWDEVADGVKSRYNGIIFRTQLQRHLHLFSRLEKDRYFPKKGSPKFEPNEEKPSIDSEYHDSLIIRILRKLRG